MKLEMALTYKLPDLLETVTWLELRMQQGTEKAVNCLYEELDEDKTMVETKD